MVISKIFKRKMKLPKKTLNRFLYNIPIHDQKGLNNCTSHAFATMYEFKLSKYFNEVVIIDVDDLWEKQKKFGTATGEGDTIQDVMKIADEYGMLFTTASGKKGLLKPRKGIEML